MDSPATAAATTRLRSIEIGGGRRKRKAPTLVRPISALADARLLRRPVTRDEIARAVCVCSPLSLCDCRTNVDDDDDDDSDNRRRRNNNNGNDKNNNMNNNFNNNNTNFNNDNTK